MNCCSLRDLVSWLGIKPRPPALGALDNLGRLRRKGILTFTLPFSSEADHKALMGYMPSVYAEERRIIISGDRSILRKVNKQPALFPRLLHLPHTLCPIVFLHDCPFFVKPSIKIPRFYCFFGSLFPKTSHWIGSDRISRSVVSDSLWPHESQQVSPPCPALTPGVHGDSRPSSQWCHPAISSSVVPFSSCPKSLPASESFPMSQLFTWGGQSTRVSASASFLPKKTQGWFPSEWTG